MRRLVPLVVLAGVAVVFCRRRAGLREVERMVAEIVWMDYMEPEPA